MRRAGFVLPERHSLKLLGGGRVMLSLPHGPSAIYDAELNDSDAEELRVRITGGPHGGTGRVSTGDRVSDPLEGYPFTSVSDELDRLRRELIAAGARAKNHPPLAARPRSALSRKVAARSRRARISRTHLLTRRRKSSVRFPRL